MNNKTKHTKEDAAIIAILAKWMNSENATEKAQLEKELPKGITQFAYCLNYNNPTKCLADFRIHNR